MAQLFGQKVSESFSTLVQYIGGNFYDGSGNFIDVSAGGVSLSYVDGSLFIRDASISQNTLGVTINSNNIFLNSTNIGYLNSSIGVLESLINTNILNISQLEASIVRIDASLGSGSGVSQAYVDGSLSNIRGTYIPDSSLSSDFYWNTSNLLRIDVSIAGTGVSPDLDYTTYSPFVGDVSFNYSGGLVSQIVTKNTIGTKTVDFVYNGEDVSTITIDNYGEATRTVTFEKNVNDEIIAVHIA